MSLPASPTSDFPCAVEKVACDLCGSRKHKVLFHARDTLYDLPGTFPVVRCSRCRLVFVNPRPMSDALSMFYPPSRYDAHQPDHDTQSALADTARRLIFVSDKSPRNTLLAQAYNTLAHRVLLPSANPGRVLDVGCGTGGYLANWKTLGWEVEGLEPVSHVADIARQKLNAPIYNGNIETTDLPQAHYDVVTMCHSLEHTLSPRTALERALRALKPGGRILIMVPNFAAWERVVFGANWLGLEVPRHLYHFEPDVLHEALSAAGFVDVNVHGTAASGTLIRHARSALGIDRDASASLPLRLALNVAMIPPALLRRSKALWAIGHKP